jgi:hypothetical protein
MKRIIPFGLAFMFAAVGVMVFLVAFDHAKDDIGMAVISMLFGFISIALSARACLIGIDTKRKDKF